MDDALNILIGNSIREVFLGGGEPTVDPSLEDFLNMLKYKDIRINLLTNGELLTDEIISIVDRIAFSIKSIDDGIHKNLVHRSNEKALRNLNMFFNEKFTFETVYIKELGCRNVLDIVEYIQKFGKDLHLRIDPLIPVNNKFSRPELEEVDRCIEEISKNTSVKAFRIKGSSKRAEVLYP